MRKKQSGDFVAGVCGELVTEIFGRGSERAQSLAERGGIRGAEELKSFLIRWLRSFSRKLPRP